MTSPNEKRLLEYVRLREALTEAEFLQEHNYPVLVLERGMDADKDHRDFSTILLNRELRDGRLPKVMARLDRGVVVPVAKQSSHLFEGMINVGRASNNDIVLDASGVSKFHAYFSKDPTSGVFHLTDANSKNGTFMNREPLRPYAQTRINDGDRVCFAGQLEFSFYSPARFFEILGLVVV